MSFASPTVNSAEPFPLLLLFGESERSVKTCHVSFNDSKKRKILHGAWQRAAWRLCFNNARQGKMMDKYCKIKKMLNKYE